MRSSLAAALTLLALSAASLFAESPRIVHRWNLAGDPHGVAVGSDGTLYVGLAQPQAVVAIDPSTGTIRRRVVLDSAEIASTKELVTLRTSRDGQRLFIANGSDESVTILGLPDLRILREITMEGEAIRDAIPDPQGRYVYLLGRRVHVFDGKGEEEIRSLGDEDPTAMAVTGDAVAVATPHAITLFDTTSFAQKKRHALETGKPVTSMLFADGGKKLIAMSGDTLTAISKDGASEEHICLPEGSGPQIATLAASTLMLAERRCNASTFSGASLYGVDAYAIAFDRANNTLVTVERAGFLTVWRVPRVAVAK